MRLRSFVLSVVALCAIAAPVVVWAGEEPSSRVPPTIPRDAGAGESLWVVFGGAYPTRAEASEAAAAISFGDLQGYYVVPVGQFQGLDQQVGQGFALVSAFRTEAGAREFVALAEGFGAPARLLDGTVRSLGGAYAGLGQEASPDGSGPLLWPLEG